MARDLFDPQGLLTPPRQMTEGLLRSTFLQQRQGMPLDVKVQMTLRRIRHWYEMYEGNVYVSFSGGADSTCLLHMVRSIYPHVTAVFVDTGVEWPEIREFVRTVPNVVWLKPKKTFKQVCNEYGYPVVSKENSQKLHEIRCVKTEHTRNIRLGIGSENQGRQKLPIKWRFLLDAPFKISHKCCHYLKKEPFFRYERATKNVPFIGLMAGESSLRSQSVAEHGCFMFGKRPQCRPLSFWTTADSHAFLAGIPHCRLYDPPFNFKRTGCMFCLYGVDQNHPNKFQTMAVTHPRIHRMALPALGITDVMDFMGQPINP